MGRKRDHKKTKTLDLLSGEYCVLSEEMTDRQLLDVVESTDAVPIEVVQALLIRGRGDSLFFRYQFNPSFCQEIREFVKFTGLDEYLSDLRNKKKKTVRRQTAGRRPVR